MAGYGNETIKMAGEIMNEEKIREYAAIMREEDLTGLEITEESMKIRLERALPNRTCSIPIAPVSAPLEQEP